MADVITRIVQGHPNSRLDELLPLGLSGYSGRGLRTALTADTP
jgi:hypothetical protein